MLASFDVSAAISSAGSVPAMPASLREWRGPHSHPCRARETGRPNPVSCLSVTHRKRGIRTRATIGSAALAVLGLLAVPGCSPAAPAAAGAAAQATADAGVRHDLSIATAQRVYGQILAKSDEAAAQGDTTAGLAIVADAQWAQVKGQYTALASAGTPVPRYQYSAPRLYVPAETKYPRWFAVSAQRRPDPGGPAVTT